MIDRRHPGIDTHFGGHAVDAETVLLGIIIRCIHRDKPLQSCRCLWRQPDKSGLAVIVQTRLGDDGRKIFHRVNNAALITPFTLVDRSLWLVTDSSALSAPARMPDEYSGDAHLLSGLRIGWRALSVMPHPSAPFSTFACFALSNRFTLSVWTFSGWRSEWHKPDRQWWTSLPANFIAGHRSAY